MKAKRRELTGRQREWLTHLRRAEARKMPLAQYCRGAGTECAEPVQRALRADTAGAAVDGQQARAEDVSFDKPICRRSDGAKSGGPGGSLPGAPEGRDDRVRESAITGVARTAGGGSTSCCALICETCGKHPTRYRIVRERDGG